MLSQGLNEIMHVKLLALCSWHIVLLKSVFLLHRNIYDHVAVFLSFLTHRTPFYLLSLWSCVFEKYSFCIILFPFFIVFLLTYHQKINHRGKKLLHSCVGASQRQEFRTGEGNKVELLDREVIIILFAADLVLIPLPVDCKLLEIDMWGPICKVKY